jgi:hypothetical protein
MLKQQSSLRGQFAALIAAVFFLFIVLPIVVKESSWCSNEENHAAEAQQQQTGNEQGATYERYRQYLKRSGFCEETKVTDLVIIFFTACLVIVGWFTIRSGERNTKDMERAYIFGTPQIDTEKSVGGNTFVEIMLHNYGHTPGTVKIIYGEVFLATEPFGDPIYKNGSPRAANGMLAPTLGNPLRAPVTFECPVKADFYFFGYVDYDDLFRRPHTSRFCAKIFLDNRGIEAAGPEAFHDWN